MHLSMETASRAVVAVLILCIVAGPATVSARTPRQEASDLYRQGNRLHNKRDYQGALLKYRQAYAMYPSYKIEYNIATSLYALGRRTEAAQNFERFLQRGGEAAPRAIVRVARERLGELSRQLASVTLSCSARGGRVLVDGKTAGRTPLPHRIYMMAGAHKIEVIKEGYPGFSRRLVLSRGEHVDLTVPWRLRIEAPSRMAPTTRQDSPGTKANGADVTLVASTRLLRDRRRTKTIWAYTTLGVGLALLGSAGALYGVGVQQGDNAHQMYRVAKERDEIFHYRGELESARTKLVVGHVLAGVGAAAIAVSIYQFVTLPAVLKRGVTRRDRVTMEISPLSRGINVSLTGRF